MTVDLFSYSSSRLVSYSSSPRDVVGMLVRSTITVVIDVVAGTAIVRNDVVDRLHYWTQMVDRGTHSGHNV